MTAFERLMLTVARTMILPFLASLSLVAAAQNETLPQTNCPRSQKQASLWYFGGKAGIDFRSGTAVTLEDKDTMTSYKSSAVMCDSTGKLLFFTDGKRVWNRSFNLMSNAASLVGSLGSTQSALIVPVPNHESKYYIFTLDVLDFKSDDTYQTNGLTYTIIDMTMWGNTGDSRDTMNFPLLTPACQKLSAVRHRNGIDFWIVAHEWNSSKYFAYRLTSSGLSAPVISETGSVTGGGFSDQANAVGYMKISPDGSLLASAISGMNRVELFDFDNNTGVLSNPRNYQTQDEGVSPYGIEFSPDNSKLYISLLQLTGSGPPIYPSRIYQFDLTRGLADPVLITSGTGIRSGGMQLAPDGRIYIARTVNLNVNKDSLDVIYNPNRPGMESNFNFLDTLGNCRFPLGERKSIYGLPTFVQSYFNLPVFTYDSICRQDSVRFRIVNKANIDSVYWNFGDGSFSPDPDARHLYAAPGEYSVTLTQFFKGKRYESSAVVPVLDILGLALPDTALLYSQTSLNLHAGGGFLSYHWSNGSADSVINVVREGYYTVRVKDRSCCYNSDTVYVQPFNYYAPNAFTPDGDGRNDVFRLVGLNALVDIEMMIYNRTGNLVFESQGIDPAWDGTWNGNPQPLGTYTWIARVRFQSLDVVTGGETLLKGTVILVR